MISGKAVGPAVKTPGFKGVAELELNLIEPYFTYRYRRTHKGHGRQDSYAPRSAGKKRKRTWKMIQHDTPAFSRNLGRK